MKKPVLQRTMFMAVGTPKSESKGILSGFDDEMENEDYEDRKPDNLEIIANNIRGDMRSMDERYLELANLVGESAFETPEEVVTLMQGRLAQQPMEPVQPTPTPKPQGIASVMQAPPATSAQGIMQGVAEEPQAQPTQAPVGQPPVAMAQGGPVYRQFGSPPMGERAQQVNQMRQNIANLMIAPGGPARAMGDFMQAQSPMLTRFSQQVFQPISTASGYAVNAINAARPYYNALGPYGRGAALGTAAVLPALTYMAGKEAPPEGGPILSEVPSIGPDGKLTWLPKTMQEMPGLPSTKRAVQAAGLTDLNFPRLGTFEKSVVEQTPTAINLAPTEEEKPAETPKPTTTVPAPTPAAEKPEVAAPTAKDFRTRVKEKMDIYREFLGDDDNMRKAQALFLLAEGALNVATARGGKSTAERLAIGLKGLPAGMAALAGEKGKQEMAIKTAAVSAAEQEIRDEAKYGAQIATQLLRMNQSNADVNTIANYLSQTQGMSPAKAVEFARLTKAGYIKSDPETGDLVDLTGRRLWSPAGATTEGDVGYIPENAPFVTINTGRLQPAAPKERPKYIESKRANQELVMDIEKLMSSPEFERMYGPIARIQSGATSILVPFTGEVKFTSVAKQQLANEARELNNRLIQMNARNQNRPSVWEQKQVEEILNNPEAILNSPEQAFAVLNNFRIKAINEINRADHVLNPSVPLKQLANVPLGTPNDPIMAKDARYMSEFFRLRPEGTLYIKLPDEKSARKITAQDFYQQFGNQPGTQ